MSQYVEKDFGSSLASSTNGLKTHHIEHAAADSIISAPMSPNLTLTDKSRTSSDLSETPYAEHGPMIDRTPTADMKVRPAGRGLMWPRIRHALREPFSEFIGTFILIMFGDGVVAQVVLSNGTKGDYQSISWGWGLGVMLGV